MESCLCARAASCASTMLCRFRSVYRSKGPGRAGCVALLGGLLGHSEGLADLGP
ncbi:hypothetical protein KY5_0640c [Streptomyces formicae]|uniref:Uncharacterized protein n=1 Tax=Streptomyces formicae TaxID=1616117 RepID=A0A291Q2D0_9ACTN|nr:hypothetical protein KY5_0640c [Streptomyces formicae]